MKINRENSIQIKNENDNNRLKTKIEAPTSEVNIKALEKIKLARAKMLAEGKSHIPEEYHKIAEGMETQFLNYMIGQMKKGVNKKEQDSQATSYYNSLLDYERSMLASKQNNGIGLKKVILDQIVPQHLKRRSHNISMKSYEQVAKGQEGSNE